MSATPPKQWRTTEADNGHEWGFWKQDALECCKLCGLVRRRDRKSNPCKGKVRVTLR